jgi:hypothetical protein
MPSAVATCRDKRGAQDGAVKQVHVRRQHQAVGVVAQPELKMNTVRAGNPNTLVEAGQ